mgnify:CR=1 FL=1|tara:strand:+ start:38 stop:466 length:429 start_codon:yes stop_codon:yes gene_type:complete
MEKYIYYRQDSTAANDDDANGSRLVPLSSFKGATMGTAAATGIITEDEDAFTMFFQPMAIPSGLKGEDNTAGALDGDACDIVIVAITTDNNAKVVMEAMVQKFNEPSIAGSNGFITLFDAVSGDKIHGDIEGITVLHADYND